MRKINEIFYSLQGEGHHTGTPAVFIRFSGCNLKCHFCDTPHQEGILMSDSDILNEVGKYPARMIILTGGEPGLWVDEELVELLHKKGKYVCIETNGTRTLPEKIDWITCSPKPEGKICLKHIDEIKVIYEGQDLAPFEKLPAQYHYVQPCSGKNTDEVIQFVLEHPFWKLSLQTHKLVGIP